MEEEASTRSREDQPMGRRNERGSGRGPNYGKLHGAFLQKIYREYIAGSSYEKLGQKYGQMTTSVYAIDVT